MRPIHNSNGTLVRRVYMGILVQARAIELAHIAERAENLKENKTSYSF